MRLVVDTNILISALLNRASNAALLLEAWERRRFELVTCEDQLDEFARVTRYPKLRHYLKAADAGTLKNQLRDVAIYIERLPLVERSPDPEDDWLLALAEVSAADYLVSGDKRGLLVLGMHGSTRILRLAEMAEVLRLQR